MEAPGTPPFGERHPDAAGSLQQPGGTGATCRLPSITAPTRHGHCAQLGGLLGSRGPAYTAAFTGHAPAIPTSSRYRPTTRVRACPWAAPTSRGTRAFEEAMREEDVPAEQSEAEEDPRIPHSHADTRRPGRHRTPAQQGSREPLRLIWRVRDRATFRALARGRRRRSGILEVTTAVVGARTEPPRVAYAIGRNVGNAVVRNRTRRRLRAAVRDARRTAASRARDISCGSLADRRDRHVPRTQRRAPRPYRRARLTERTA